MELMYQNNSKAEDRTWLQDYNVSNLSLEEMFLKMGHRKEDFIIKYDFDFIYLLLFIYF